MTQQKEKDNNTKEDEDDTDNTDNHDNNNEEGILLQQTLMSHDECFVYHVPPLVSADGYRANTWNLASPLQECGFQVERRNNELYLLFTLENHTKLFAVSKMEGNPNNNLRSSIETVLDSSRYFVTKIMEQSVMGRNTKNKTSDRTATIGFGFRDRDIAIDLLGNLQQFQRSIQRQLEASEMKAKMKSIPVMKKDETIHITMKGGNKKNKKTKKKAGGNSTGSGGSGGLLLLKKPPPSAVEQGDDNTDLLSAAAAAAVPVSSSATIPPITTTTTTPTYSRQFSMSSMESPIKDMTVSTHNTQKQQHGDDDDENSEAAVATDSTNQSGTDSIDEFDEDDDDDFGEFQQSGAGQEQEQDEQMTVDDDELSEAAVGGAISRGSVDELDTDDDDDDDDDDDNNNTNDNNVNDDELENVFDEFDFDIGDK